VRDTFGLSDEEMAGIARTSVAASHSSPATKQRALDAIDTWLRTPA
jgi:adenosine deaminase